MKDDRLPLLAITNILAVDVEAGVRPRKQPLCPIRAEKLPADEKGQHLTGEDLGETRVVRPYKDTKNCMIFTYIIRII